ncbi:MAG TPA: hypothetical protein VNG12_00555 [Acidimicrobiales bacterium]|nr:hypothetical protein [Acidimicrobiales bacterium]
MTNSPLFSTYRGGENRVTSSMMAVFQRLELSLLERLLGAVAGEAALQLVAFANQPAGAGASVPDARISARFDYWFETKTVPNALGAKQIGEHHRNLTPDAEHERLFVVTPDPVRPEILDSLNDDRVIWFNFRAMSDAIDDVLDDDSTFVGEQTRFLLRELQQLFSEDGLLDMADTVVVAARFAWGEYNDHGVYICQPDRSFRPGLTHMGFYAHGAIQPKIAKILDQRPQSITFDGDTVKELQAGGSVDQRIAESIEASFDNGIHSAGQPYRVFVLSHPDDEETVTLSNSITNTTKAASGRTFAWTMSQRYTRLSALTKTGITTTTELEEAGG